MGGNEPPVPGAPKTATDYLRDSGASPFHNVFSDAGHEPAAAVNYPIRRQVHIAAQQTQREFNFKSVDLVGVTDKNHVEFRDMLMNIYHGGQAMMAALGRPHSAMGMGDITLRLEPEPAPGQALGSFHWPSKTLTLKGRYVTLGHEWAHAEDHAMIRKLGIMGNQPLASLIARTRGVDPNRSVTEAFGHVVNSLFFDHADLAAKTMDLEVRSQATDAQGNLTPDAQRAQQELTHLKSGASNLPASSVFRRVNEAIDKARGGKPYWGTIYELLARSREAHIAQKLEADGIDPRGVVMPDEAYASQTIQGLKDVYPSTDERAGIFAAWDAFDRAMEQEAVHGAPRGAGSADPGMNLLLQAQKTPGWPKLSDTYRATLAAMADWRNNLKDINPWNPDRPEDSERSFMTHVADLGRSIFYTKGALVETAGERARTPEAKRLVNTIRDKMGPRYGTRRYVPEGFEERQRRYTHEMLRDYANVIQNSEIIPNRMTPQKLAQLDDALTSGNISGLDANDRRFVQGMRYLLDRAVQRLQGAGYDIAQIGQYRPRMYDIHKMGSDKQGFVDAATTLYKKMFDDELPAPNSDEHVEALLGKWRELGPQVRQQLPQNVQDMMKNLRDNMTKQRRIERQIAADPTKAAVLQPQLDQLRQDARVLAEQAHDPVGNWIANAGAEDWHMRATTFGEHEFQRTGPGGGFLSHRELPPEADQIMKDYLIHDFRVWAPMYFMGVGKAQAKAEVWGSNWEKLNDLIDQARRAKDANGEYGLLTGDDNLIRKAVQRSVENGVAYENRGVARAVNFIQSLGALVMLPRTPITVLSEFTVGGMAHNDVRVAWRNFTNMLGQFGRTANARQVADLANWFGITTTHYQNAAMMDRHMMTDFRSTPNFAKFMDKYYEISGMSGLTRVNQRAAMETSHWLARKNAVDLRSNDANTQEDAQTWFNEHGVPPQFRNEYADWLIGHDTLADIDKNDPMWDIHRIVMQRAVSRQVLVGSRVNTPMQAEHYLGRLPFQFLNYAYQFQKSILDPTMEQQEHVGRRAYRQARQAGASKAGANFAGMTAGSKFLAGFAATIAAATVGQLLTSTIREFLYNRRGWDKHMEDGDLDTWLLGLAFQRTGIGGTLDPVAQFITGLRYTADISSILEGASINNFQRNIMMLLGPWLKPETNTNTLRYEANQALWNLTFAPLMAFAGVGLGSTAGPLAPLAAPLVQWGTSRDAAEWFASMVQGPKGAEPAKPDTGQLPGLGGGLEGLPKLGAEEKGPEGTTGLGGLVPLGLLDDMALPLVQRVLVPMFSMAPAGLKQAIAAAGSLIAGYEWWQSGAETRGQPAPEKPAKK